MNRKLLSEILDLLIKDQVDSTLNKRDAETQIRLVGTSDVACDYHASDTIGELLEKLAILHIRTWHLEDAMQQAKTDSELADLKRKVDICFKVKRPKLVAALNAIFDDAISNKKSLKEDSVKLYKGI